MVEQETDRSRKASLNDDPEISDLFLTAARYSGVSEEKIRAILQTIYKTLLLGGDNDRDYIYPNFESISALIGLTGISPQFEEDLVQRCFGSFMRSNGLDSKVEKLITLSGVEPIFEREDIQKRFVLWMDSDHKDDSTYFSGLKKMKSLMEEIRLVPKKSAVKQAYAKYLLRLDVQYISRLCEVTGVPPKFTEKQVHNAYSYHMRDYHRRIYPERTIKHLDEVFKLTGIPAKEEVLCASIVSCFVNRESAKLSLLWKFIGDKPLIELIESGYKIFMDWDSEYIRTFLGCGPGDVSSGMNLIQRFYQKSLSPNAVLSTRNAYFFELLKTTKIPIAQETIQKYYSWSLNRLDVGSCKQMNDITGIPPADQESVESCYAALFEQGCINHVGTLIKITGLPVPPKAYMSLVSYLRKEAGSKK